MQHAARTKNGSHWRQSAAFVALALGLPAGAAAQGVEQTARSYAYGNLSHVEGDVWHQRADDFGAHEAETNSPFLPGDRIWTREPGLVEIRLAGRITAWIEEGTKLDYVEGDNPHRFGFWTGSLVVAVDGDSEIVVETPGGTLSPQGRGEYRADLLKDGRTVQFVVHDGIATVSTEWGSVLVGAGQRTLGSEGTAPAPVEEYRGHDDFSDDFMAWIESRQEWRDRAAHTPADDLPQEVREHARDLHGHGRWHQNSHLGWVWYPTVSAGWAPYRLGRWAHTPFGYTWISYDTWGWAPFHYGSWGHGPFGWYWIPGSLWSPGWVSWSYGPSWVGWAPLGYYGRPVYDFWGYDEDYALGNPGHGLRRGQVLGKAVRRGSAINRQAWSFTERSAIGRPASRNRLAASSLRNVEAARVLSRGATLDRNLQQRAVGSTGMIRSAKATSRRLANSRNAVAGGAAAAGRSTTRAQRVAVPSRAIRARSNRMNRTNRESERGSTALAEKTVRRGAAQSGTAQNRTGRADGGAGAAVRRGAVPRRPGARPAARSERSRPPRPRAAGSGTRRPSSVRPSSGSSRSRPSGSSSRSRPSGSASRSRPSSGASRSRPSSGASRSRPSSGASRSRPSSTSRSRPSSTSRSRPSSASRSRPSSTSRSRPSSTPRSRPSSAPRSRPSSTSRSRPSSTSRSRPSSTSRSRPSSTPRSRPSSTPGSRPSSTPGSRPSSTSRSRPSSTPRSRSSSGSRSSAGSRSSGNSGSRSSSTRRRRPN